MNFTTLINILKNIKLLALCQKCHHFVIRVFVLIIESVVGGRAINMDLPWIDNQQFCQSIPCLHSVYPAQGRLSTQICPRLTINRSTPDQIKYINTSNSYHVGGLLSTTHKSHHGWTYSSEPDGLYLLQH